MRKLAFLLLIPFLAAPLFAQDDVHEDLGEEITAGEAYTKEDCQSVVNGTMSRIEAFTRMKFRRRVPLRIEPKASWEQRLKATGFAGETARSGLAYYNIIFNSITVVPWTIGGYHDGKPDKRTKRYWMRKLESILIHELTHAIHHQNFYVVLGGARSASLRASGLSEEEIDISTVEFLTAEGVAELVAARTVTTEARSFLMRFPAREVSGPVFYWQRYQPDGKAPYRVKLSRFGYQDGMDLLQKLTKKAGMRGVRAVMYRQPPRELFFQPDLLATIELEDPPEPDSILGFLSPEILQGGEIHLAVNPGAGRFFPGPVQGAQRARAPGCLVGYAAEVGEEDGLHGYSRYAFFVADPDRPGTWSQEQANSLRSLGTSSEKSKPLPMVKGVSAKVLTTNLEDGSRYVRAEASGLVVLAHESKPTSNLEERVLGALRVLYIDRPKKDLFKAALTQARQRMGK